MARIYAPNKDYNGESASVKFQNGVGETDDPNLIGWFTEHGYSVEDEPLCEEFAIQEQTSVEIQIETPTEQTESPAEQTEVKETREPIKVQEETETQEETEIREPIEVREQTSAEAPAEPVQPQAAPQTETPTEKPARVTRQRKPKN